MILAVLQARMSSTRLPEKVLKPILGKPMLMRMVERVQRSKKIDTLVVATSDTPDDDPIEALCGAISVPCFRGSLTDVLDRFYHAAEPYAPDHVARLTGDCPLIDPEVMDATIGFYLQGKYDYASNCQAPYTFPDGLDTEVCRFSALESAWKEAILPSQREHVMPFIRKQPERFRVGHYMNSVSLGHFRWTVDEAADFELVTKIYEALYPQSPTFSMKDILEFLEKNPAFMHINNQIGRNEGSKKSLEADKTFLGGHI